MIILDVNILVYVARQDFLDHHRYESELMDILIRQEELGICDVVRAGFIRVVTNPKSWSIPTTLEDAFSYLDWLSSFPSVVHLEPGPQHFAIFEGLCLAARATGNLVTDAYLAAFAIENSAELFTSDRDFERFPGLNWTRL